MTEERLPPIAPERMDEAQQKVAAAIMAGPRKDLRGPFNAWLRSPELADRLQRVGEYVRFTNSLPKRLNEMAILITARYWTAQLEWFLHLPMALEAGLDARIADAIAAGERPRDMQPDEAAIYDFVTELHRDKNVGEASYRAALDAFGEQGLVDLVGVAGYYTVVSMTLNVAGVPLPGGLAPPLKPLARA
ncbi:MAG TPA: carboxymuconolactone decarboxylase family protein [Aliidongia sp.]|nr:carboxymuconolactone decarboxylase family protein [Aliidongia sp.]